MESVWKDAQLSVLAIDQFFCHYMALVDRITYSDTGFFQG